MNSLFHQAMLGSLAADAVAMPVHWYYDTNALDNDYGTLSEYVAPHNPHSGSILWRSKYKPRNKRGDILHDQASYWGQRGIHYHQFLSAGENTINYKLGVELYRLTVQEGGYNQEAWLERYAACMLEKGWHKDTYVEEYHRAFFDNYAQGHPLMKCGINDLHIGGLSQVPCLLAALDHIGISSLEDKLSIVETHVRLTHQNTHVVQSAHVLTQILHALAEGMLLRDAIARHGKRWASEAQFDTWSNFPDRTVIGKYLTPACYLPESFTASLYLCWKYAEDFSAGILANAHCGGDNCHRGAVVGALLAAADEIPAHWLKKLHAMPQDEIL